MFLFNVIIEIVHSKVKFQGLTGEVQFNLITGERRVHNGLDILNVVQHHVKKVCLHISFAKIILDLFPIIN